MFLSVQPLDCDQSTPGFRSSDWWPNDGLVSVHSQTYPRIAGEHTIAGDIDAVDTIGCTHRTTHGCRRAGVVRPSRGVRTVPLQRFDPTASAGYLMNRDRRHQGHQHRSPALRRSGWGAAGVGP
jgi:hypothetical protein